MPRLALKPDSSFFRKIALGAIGTRAIALDLAHYGHSLVELERGSLHTKLWKEVKRKRVRIPDLLCTRCGLRIESRAKTKSELTMSHSPADEARAWDFGMVDTDYVAFPVCEPASEKYWSAGRLGSDSSYWHERSWIRWRQRGRINYFTVSTFRSTPYAKVTTKGVTEGSETSVGWLATFSSRTGTVESLSEKGIKIRRALDGHSYTWPIRSGVHALVSLGDVVEHNQIIASVVDTVPESALSCPNEIAEDHILHLLTSRERTQRFTGVKLARLRRDATVQALVESLTSDAEEDVYIRLEGASYLASVCNWSARELFGPYLASVDDQTHLEAVIALGEMAIPESVELLSEILDDSAQPYFVRSAAAWCLGQVGSEQSTRRLVRAFSDIDRNIREEALDGIVSLGGGATPVLLAGLREMDEDIAAGCAEALRQQQLSGESLSRLAEELTAPMPSKWAVWLLGFLPRQNTAAAISELQDKAPQLHYAVSLLWSFVDNWISRRWELNPGSTFPESGEAFDVPKPDEADNV